MSAGISSSETRPKSGEIIKIRSRLGIFPESVFQVDMVTSQMVHLSAGDIRMGCAWNSIEITGRNQEKPICWEEEEVKILRAQAKLCRCSRCAELLKTKLEKLKSMQV